MSDFVFSKKDGVDYRLTSTARPDPRLAYGYFIPSLTYLAIEIIKDGYIFKYPTWAKVERGMIRKYFRDLNERKQN